MKIFRPETSYDFQQKFKRHLWQKKFYDHILRQTDSIERVASYIWMNPVRKGLCERPQDYPPSRSNDDRDAKGAKGGRYQSNTRLLGRC